METALSKPRTVYQTEFPDYGMELIAHLSDAWASAHRNIKKAQNKQKTQHDKHSEVPKIKLEDRVMVYFPLSCQRQSKEASPALPWPYQVLSLTPTNAEVCLVGKPQGESIFIALDRTRVCPAEMTDETWIGLNRTIQDVKDVRLNVKY